MQRGSYVGSSRVFAAAIAVATAAFALLVSVPRAQAFDPAVEADNNSKTHEREAIYTKPGYQAQLRETSATNAAAARAMQVNDSERAFGGHLCTTGEDGCAGDVRLYDWQTNGYGIVQPVLFTARSGATISGHVWATRGGPAKRPGIVITNGSIQAPEQLYWFAAQTLAKAGYVVLTSDPQGQGQSDERGESPDENEGTPAQTDGRPFYDGTQDALEFFFSTPKRPYVPLKSCDSGTSHAAKQNRRAAAGLNAAYNPFWAIVNPNRIGLAGHSFGASGVSFVGQKDPRVDAIVAWDNLGAPNASRVEPCPSDPASHDAAPITKPALGMSADYGLTSQPYTSDPNPLAKSQQSLAYNAAGVDTGELVIRGGTHYEFSWIPNPGFGATLRGADVVSWYTTAWFDKYVKGVLVADKRLLTRRWHDDAAEAQVDPRHDGNMWSFYYRSRLDITRSDGSPFNCEDLRAGCPGMLARDGQPPNYDYVTIATAPDSGPVPPNAPEGTGIYHDTAQLPAP